MTTVQFGCPFGSTAPGSSPELMSDFVSNIVDKLHVPDGQDKWDCLNTRTILMRVSTCPYNTIQLYCQMTNAQGM